MLDKLGGFGSVISGDKPIRVQAELQQSDMQQLAVYLFGAFFLAVLLANFIIKKV